MVVVCAFAAVSVLSGCQAFCPFAAPEYGEEIPFAMPRLEPPCFGLRSLDIRDFGAVGDWQTVNTAAFAEAISECNRRGGGRVVVPKGTWLTGPIHLKSNVHLYIGKGAEIRFSTDPEDYLPAVFTRWEGIECYNYSPFIYAYRCTNIAITGPGKLNGQGQPWWSWKDSQQSSKLRWMGRENVPVTERIVAGGEFDLRPSFIQPVHCRNVYLEGLTITNGPMWTVHPLYCNDVIIRNLHIVTEGPNGDGVNPDSCRNVVIEGCYFDTGDDCIAIKSGRDEDGRRVGRACENLLIRNCRTRRGHGGVVIGSEMSGGVRNVLVEKCYFNNTDRGIRLKTARGRGGVVENLFVRDVTMERIGQQAIRLNMLYESVPPEPESEHTPVLRNISFENITCRSAGTAVEIRGLPERPVSEVKFENIDISAEEGFRCSDAEQIIIINLRISPEAGPVFSLENVRGVLVQNSGPAEAVETFLQVKGRRCADIVLQNNDLACAETPITFREEVPEGAIIVTEQPARAR